MIDETDVKVLYNGEKQEIYCKLYKCLSCNYYNIMDDKLVKYCPHCGKIIKQSKW